MYGNTHSETKVTSCGLALFAGTLCWLPVHLHMWWLAERNHLQTGAHGNTPGLFLWCSLLVQLVQDARPYSVHLLHPLQGGKMGREGRLTGGGGGGGGGGEMGHA